jgi:uncharacterized protein
MSRCGLFPASVNVEVIMNLQGKKEAAINATEEEIKDILKESKIIAVVGLSANGSKPSYDVARYLIAHGYRVVPVNPAYDEVLGETSYKSLLDIPFDVDIVDVFRKTEDIPPVVDDAIEKKAKTVWLQLGLVHDEAAEKAQKAGLKVVQDRCMKIEHHKLG